ncbi:MAG: flavin reductase family protein [Clostridiales bacterium]|nr:flavin reductase family protein [Clostridiales bacterium]
MKIEMPPSTMLNPVPVVMVSCAGKEPCNPETGPNIITVAWAGTVNSEPPMVSVSIRKSRHSHDLICQSSELVINLVTEDLAKACDYCGVRSGRNEDKFKKMKLHPKPAPGLQYAPLIDESPVSLSCKLRDIIELGSHDMFLAEVVAVSVDEKLLDNKGKICLEKAGLITYSHGEYYTLGKMLGFFGYSVASKEALKRRMPKKMTKKSNKK